MPTRRPHPVRGEIIRSSSARSDRIPRRFLRSLQEFLGTESAGSVLLLAATVVALVFANSPLRGAYERLWHTRLYLQLGPWSLSEDLRHLVNDGLMGLFFLVLGLEIRREMLTGELRDRRAAVLPAVAALGGILVPVAIYVAVNAGGPGADGWGVPTATDIALALGVLTVAARHAPPGLKPFLLTIAIVDDIVAIVVIAVFYSTGVRWASLVLALLLLLAIAALQGIRVHRPALYAGIGILVWLAVAGSGIHPTVAGATVGLLTPAVPVRRARDVSDEVHWIADEMVDDPFRADPDADLFLRLDELARETVSPLARLESVLHPWTSLLIVPLFALANAGVRLSSDAISEAVASPITLGIVLGLVAGKALGISLASAAAVRFGVASLPQGMTWLHVVGVGAVAGIGFTVAIFLAELAFPDARSQEAAEAGILAASLLAGVIGWAILSTREPTAEPSARIGERPKQP